MIWLLNSQKRSCGGVHSLSRSLRSSRLLRSRDCRFKDGDIRTADNMKTK